MALATKLLRPVATLWAGRSLRHAPVALDHPETPPAEVVLRTPGGEAPVGDVITPLSLVPFRIGFALPPASERLAGFASGTLIYRDRASGVALGEIDVVRKATHAGAALSLVEVAPRAARMFCVGALERSWKHYLARRQARVALGRPGHLPMSYPDLRALNVFYVLPRPVYLVTVECDGRDNIFPMDLVRPLGADRFVLALRESSPSVALISASGRMVVSSAPAAEKALVYQLGTHHKRASVDWDSLPMRTRRTPGFGLRAPDFALRVRELRVDGERVIGSHRFFETTVVGDQAGAEGAQLGHVSDMYRRWLERRGRGLPPA